MFGLFIVAIIFGTMVAIAWGLSELYGQQEEWLECSNRFQLIVLFLLAEVVVCMVIYVLILLGLELDTWLYAGVIQG